MTTPSGEELGSDPPELRSNSFASDRSGAEGSTERLWVRVLGGEAMAFFKKARGDRKEKLLERINALVHMLT